VSDERDDPIPAADATLGPAARASAEIGRLLAEPLAPGLYLVATPIGNLADITLRALSVLQRADVVYCEDTRHSARLLQHFAISARTRPLHDHNEERESARIIGELQSGRCIAIISDAGTPLVSDPGFRLVRAAAEQGIAIFAVPGASAILPALTTSGLPTDAFFFAGFLPPKFSARSTRLEELAAVPGTLIFYEAPHRVAETISDMARVLGARHAVIARELTKLHETVMRGTLAELAEALQESPIKGEVVIVVGPEPPGARDVSDDVLASRLLDVLPAMRLKDAAKMIADEFKVPRARVYGLGLKAKDGRS
jgi:16S rRNA (cytidine1402-2'-O)-methyltransferase